MRRFPSIIIIPCLLFLLGQQSFAQTAAQSPQDKIRQHYQAAEAARLAGNLDVAGSEYAAIAAEGYERLAWIYSARSDYQLAVTVLEAAQLYRPNSPELLVDLAIAHFNAQQYDRAVVAANKVLAVAPNNPGAHQMLGKSFFMLGDLGKSIAELEIAAKLAPNDLDVVYTLGIAYLRNRQPDAAKQLYNSLVKLAGEQPQLHVIIGRAYRQSGLLAEAAEEFKKAIALDPRFPRAHYYLGITYLLDEGQSKTKEALEEFKLEVAANPDEFFANYYLGVVYNFQRQWELAISFLQKAANAQPDNPDPYFQLSQAYQELNNHEQAIAALRKTIALNPNLAHNKGQVTTAHHRLAQSLFKTGQTAAGRTELQIASELKAEAFKLEQQTQSSVAGMGELAAVGPDKDLLELGARDRGTAVANNLDENVKRELQRSEVYYQKIVATAHNNLGLLRAERQDFRGAAEQFALAAKWDSQLPGIDYNLGLAYFKSQSYKEAIRPLENELRLHPDNQPAARLLGLTLFRSGDYAKASDLLSAAVAAQSADIDTYYALTSSLIKQQKKEAADQLIEQIKTTAGEVPQLHLLLAEKFAAAGVRDKALAELREAVASNSKALLVHYNAGLLYLHLDKRDEAIAEFEKELVLNAEDIQAKSQLELAKQLRRKSH